MEAELTKVQSKLEHLRAMRRGEKGSSFLKDASEPLTPNIAPDMMMYEFEDLRNENGGS